MNILDFLFGNIFFVILILGALWNFFSRQAEARKEAEQGKKPQREQEIDWKEIFRQEQAPDERDKPQPTVARDVEPSFEPSFEPIRQEVDTAAKDRRTEMEKLRDQLEEKRKKLKHAEISTQSAISDSPIMKNEIGKKRTKLDLDFQNISQEEAMKGIIWTEILGKPRAMRSYSNKR
ncbi:hypothetical protein [Alkalihalobacterium chitinilyticum]|uniref:Atg14 domain-containing protein n=1 Tax=Alkalihalobacterium chitinilyticum TaxID=2980103 RepID=A0ABT5VF51_9BACI|nr:hypothetical protein [Alkalihalobacterium chitinilyticum]MDE5413895.1 Atg14 domain-containing protein [Alkalihalobacterium chitinilyticum]